MMPWTVKQEEVMREHCFRGVEAVQQALAEECGVIRTLHAIEAHASRIHISLRVRHQCPECGVIGVHLNRQNGLCRRCSDLLHIEEERAFNQLLEAEVKAAENPEELQRLEREYAMLRKRNSRLCKQHGLKPRSKRV